MASCFWLGAVVGIPISSVEIHWRVKDSQPGERYVPSHSVVSGREMVMVYLGAYSCAFANDEALPRIVERIKLGLQDKAVNEGMSFSAIGVAVDWRVGEGVEHLEKFGQFDEILAGRKWHGVGSLQFFKERLAGVAATPQVLVFKRDIEAEEGAFRVSNERVLVRKMGVLGIGNWLERGLPLPENL